MLYSLPAPPEKNIRAHDVRHGFYFLSTANPISRRICYAPENPECRDSQSKGFRASHSAHNKSTGVAILSNDIPLGLGITDLRFQYRSFQ